MALPFVMKLLNQVRLLKVEPVGVIRPYAADVVPIGWAECDGDALISTNSPLLFSVIGTRFGNGSIDKDGAATVGGEDFNLPDLRGRFVRGHNNGSGNDPNAGARGSDSLGANPGQPWRNTNGLGVVGQVTGDNIGSMQGSSFTTHTHTIAPGGTIQRGPDGAVPIRGNGATNSATPLGRDDTRPVNISFMYIMRT